MCVCVCIERYVLSHLQNEKSNGGCFALFSLCFCFAFCMNIGRITGFTLEVFQETSVVAGESNLWGPGGKVWGMLFHGLGGDNALGIKTTVGVE